VEIGLVGDCRRSLQALLPLLKKNGKRGFLAQAQSSMQDWNKLMEKQATATTSPMKPQVVAAELGKRLAANAIVSCDSGTIATWWARHIPARRGQMHTVSGNLATMACGLPYAIAAQVAYPNRQCVAFVGDGGFTMLMGDFVTAVRYQLPVKVIVMKNNSLGQIKWEQMVYLCKPEFGCDLTPIDFAAFARACGAKGYTIHDAGQCGDVLDEALRADGPAVIEAVIDPNEPPMPPKVTARQAAHFAESLAKGTPDRRKIIGGLLEDKIRELV
jgi:pyruvate dehydrogenase (quinone)/pyruvate oxidase